VGKIVVVCEFISLSEIKAHILDDQRHQSEIIEASRHNRGIR